MTIEITAIGGYSEIGRNCTAIKYKEEIVIFDMGLHMEKYIEHTDSESDYAVDMSPEALIKVGAVPDIEILKKEKQKVKAICLGQAHLDHMAAAVFLSNKFNCPIYGTHFTIEVIKEMIKDEKINFKNRLIAKDENSQFKISKNITIEFINITHSTPQAVAMAVHTKEGTILYANDFKIDNNPTLGKKTNMKRLQEIKPKALICDCLYSNNPSKTPSEAHAQQMLKEILLDHNLKGKNIFVTTFSSQIARINSIKKIARKTGRKVVFLGRSLAKYAMAAENCNLINLSDINIVKFSSKVKRFLTNINHPEKHLFVVTGHQGEPKAVLSKIVEKGYFSLKPKDVVIFSCQIIPVPINYENRTRLESELKAKKVTIYKDIHSSGHASGKDHEEFIKMINPENLIPTHGDLERMQAMKEIAVKTGMKEEKIHFLKNKDTLKI